MSYTVYMVECADGTFYTGIATDTARRVREHNESPRGAAYTKGRRPVALVYEEACVDRSAAQKREYAIRILPRVEKLRLLGR